MIHFIVDEKLKKNCRDLNRKSLKTTKTIIFIAVLILLVGIVSGTIVFINAFNNPENEYINVDGVLTKDYSWIIISTALCLIPCCMIAFFLRVLANNIAGTEITARVNETLTIYNNTLTYVYRLRFHTFVEQRMEVIINLDKMRTIEYNEKNQKITFKGDIVFNKYEDIRTNQISDSQNGDEFVLFDYFNPNLYNAVSSNNYVRRKLNV